MSDFIAAEDRAILERHGLADYDALWALQLEAVDEPNTERGGWSSVYRLDLGEAAYYLKRQSNHLTHSLLRVGLWRHDPRLPKLVGFARCTGDGGVEATG